MNSECRACPFRNVNYKPEARADRYNRPCWHPAYITTAIGDFVGDPEVVVQLDKIEGGCPIGVAESGRCAL